jgi:hypothetical protein
MIHVAQNPLAPAVLDRCQGLSIFLNDLVVLLNVFRMDIDQPIAFDSQKNDRERSARMTEPVKVVEGAVLDVDINRSGSLVCQE